MSGIELQAKLKTERCRIPIIFITGRGDIPSAVNAMKEGASDFFTKPVDGTALLDSVEKALQRDRANRQKALARIDADANGNRQPDRRDAHSEAFPI